MGPHRSKWISSRIDLDLCSLVGKGFLMFFPRAQPLHILVWVEFKLGIPEVILPILGSELKPMCPSLLCHISLEFFISWLRAWFWIFHSLYKVPSLVPIVIAFLRLVFLGQYKTLSSLKVTWKTSSVNPEIEIRFFLF